jgi:hypothetical protein
MTDHNPCGLFALGDYMPDTYCGPSAIAALTGKTVAQVEDAILAYRRDNPAPRGHRGKARVKTTWTREIVPVLRALGYEAREITLAHGRSLSRNLKALKRHGYDERPLLILITGHFIAVHGGWFVDTCQRMPALLKGHRYMRRAVKYVWTIEKQGA